MSKVARIQGDWHASRKDPDALFERSTNDSDAYFREGRSNNVVIYEWSIRYLVYTIGYLQILLLQAFPDTYRDIVPWGTSESIEEEANRRGLQHHSEIDAELSEIWEHTGNTSKRLGLFTSVVFLLFSVGLAWGDFTVVGFNGGLFSLLIFYSSSFLFPVFLIGEMALDSARDRIMADSIHEVSTENGYTEILVLVGDAHVPGVVEELESKGWETDVERSNPFMARFARRIRRLVAKVLRS